MKEPRTSRSRFRKFRTEKLWKKFISDDRDREQERKPGGPEAPPPVPKDRAEEKARRKRYLKQYFHWLWPYRGRITGLHFLGTLAMIFEQVQPAALGLIIDRILKNQELAYAQRLSRLQMACLGLLALLILSRMLATYRNLMMVRFNSRLTIDLRRRLHERLLYLSLFDLGEYKTGGIVSRLSGDVEKAGGFLQMAILSPAGALERLAFTGAILLWWNWKLALVAWAMLLPMVGVSFLWVRRVRPVYRSIANDRTLADARATETFMGIRVVRSFRREARERKDYALGYHTMIRKRIYANILEQALDAVWEPMVPAVALMILWVGGTMILNDKASIGQIVAFMSYGPMILWPIVRIVFSMQQMQESLAAMERVFDVLAKPVDKPDAPDALTAPREVREIRFEHVDFAYRPGVPVLTDFHLRVPGGATVALVGPSGAGKTTVTDLVARFYDPTQGAILLNGVDLRRLRLRSYRGMLATVQQDVFLFDGTVKENIAYGRRNISEAQIMDAARRANAHDFIAALPEGYDTLIGERGLKLSGGQRQRLSIARAVLADPQILILDEATSNLDTESERLIQAALTDLLANRTTFVIAHRLSTVAHADLIVVIDHGRIVETGTHVHLMAAGGMYYDMVERQRKFSEPTAAEASSGGA